MAEPIVLAQKKIISTIGADRLALIGFLFHIGQVRVPRVSLIDVKQN